MARKIFISLNNRDSALAEALRDVLKSIFEGLFEVHFSTSKELAGGIRSGEDWFQWIVKQVQECDKAFVLVTPNSVQAPWLMWESGAVFGAAMASGTAGYGKIWPIIFQLKSSEMPSPIRDSKAQRRYGDRGEEVKRMVLELFDEYKAELKGDAFGNLAKLDGVLEGYLDKVHAALLNAPAIPTETVLAEWRQRVKSLKQEDRGSEARQLQHWMEVAFGRENDEDPQPVDLGIHVQLGELYADNKEYDRAIQQLELARRLGSRDVFVLRSLGRLYLDDGDRDKAKEILDRIKDLDSAAFEKNAECAALLGRYNRETGNLADAAENFKAALASNPKSYYLANVLAEVYLELEEFDRASRRFRQAVKIVDEEIGETNVWTLATKANAGIALGDLTMAGAAVDDIAALTTSAGERDTVRRGMRGIAKRLDPEPDITRLLSKLS